MQRNPPEIKGGEKTEAAAEEETPGGAYACLQRRVEFKKLFIIRQLSSAFYDLRSYSNVDAHVLYAAAVCVCTRVHVWFIRTAAACQTDARHVDVAS